jgi:hypothetical protein
MCYLISGQPCREFFVVNSFSFLIFFSKNLLQYRVMVFNATFNNISVEYQWRSVLLVEETGVPGEKHQPAASH